MTFPLARRAVACPPIFEVPEPFAENCLLTLRDADGSAVIRKPRPWLSPAACHKLSQVYRWLVGWRFDQAYQSALFDGSESLEAVAWVAGRWPNTSFNRTRRQRAYSAEDDRGFRSKMTGESGGS